MPGDGVPSSEKVHTVKAEGESERLPVNGGDGLYSSPKERDRQRKSHRRWLQRGSFDAQINEVTQYSEKSSKILALCWPTYLEGSLLISIYRSKMDGKRTEDHVNHILSAVWCSIGVWL